MAGEKTIAVVGATGAQGGGLARAILNDPNGEFRARAITRNVDSDKAKQLAGLGADLVGADLDDAASLKKAFSGAAAAFCVTNYWEHFSPEKEIQQAKNLAQAAKDAGVKHVIWSTLEDTRNWVPLDDDRLPTLAGNYKVPHFDTKGASNRFFNELGVPTTFLLTSFYWENFIFFGMAPKKTPDGKFAFAFPMGDKKLPGIAVEDIGKSAYAIFKKGSEFIGKTIGIAGEHLTGAEMASAFSKAFGKPVQFDDVPPEVYRGFGFPGADDLGNMFQFKRDFNDYFCGARNIESTKALNPALQNFDAWLAQNKNRITLE